ncbi:BH3-interacting domain death agonist-like [Leucoraja erinacea]|uniref:BH3-interacting domain death agonist-like n=1 Tax=Leucoraja erinaceus TaxID=7782 RepID=UPI002458A8B3|nr:BH3-interacting domain death agonist-like [Leucoraja erinacea]
MLDLREQTAIIIDHLLDPDFWSCLLEADCDSPDPISEEEKILKVAQCLRAFGDQYNDMIQEQMKEFKPRLTELKNNQASEGFSRMVTELSNSRVLCTHAEQLGPEMNVLRTTVILGMYISKEVPELLPRIKDAMVNYINTNLLTWIRQSGGWENLL